MLNDRSAEEFRKEFFPALGEMFAKFMEEAQNDNKKISIMMERLVHVLGILTAVAAKGDPEFYDEINLNIQAVMDKNASDQLAYLKKLQDEHKA